MDVRVIDCQCFYLQVRRQPTKATMTNVEAPISLSITRICVRRYPELEWGAMPANTPMD